jgi:hypothetical protein
MGLGLSVESLPVVDELRTCLSYLLSELSFLISIGKWAKVSSTIRRFLDEQMEFEMGKEELIKLTELSSEKVNQIIGIISRNNSERSFSSPSLPSPLLTSALPLYPQSQWNHLPRHAHSLSH